LISAKLKVLEWNAIGQTSPAIQVKRMAAKVQSEAFVSKIISESELQCPSIKAVINVSLRVLKAN